jgi:Tfp pilus assembly protein PilN
MINLLPPQAKSESTYAKRNQVMLRYISLLILIALVLAVELGGAAVYIQQQGEKYTKETEAKTSQIATFKSLEDQAKAANSRLKAFKTLSGNQARFSSLLADLASHTPKGVSINSITLTGDASQAVKIAATANSYASAAGFRDALATSDRVKDAAIEDIANPGEGVYKVNVTVAFKPGGSK